MKINRLEAHDRLQYLIKDQSINIFQGAEDCLKRNALSLAIQDKSPYVYLFAHPRTADDGVNKKMFWQPRLSIPEPQTNSYLFRAQSKTDLIETIWLIPPPEMWSQYQKGNITEHETVNWSINEYKNRREELAKPHPDDMSEERGRMILKQIVDDHRKALKMKPKREIWEASQAF
jgi:hypothetical protein